MVKQMAVTIAFVCLTASACAAQSSRELAEIARFAAPEARHVVAAELRNKSATQK